MATSFSSFTDLQASRRSALESAFRKLANADAPGGGCGDRGALVQYFYNKTQKSEPFEADEEGCGDDFLALAELFKDPKTGKQQPEGEALQQWGDFLKRAEAKSTAAADKPN